MNTLESIAYGVLSSAIFLIIISRFKPKIKISDSIATHKIDTQSGKKPLFVFKIINRSWFYKAYDIKIKAYVCDNFASLNGENVSFSEIVLRKNDQWVLPRVKWRHLWQDTFWKERRLDGRTDYAAQFSTHHDLKTCLNERKYITFEVIAKHSLTGFSIVKTKHYKHIQNIKEGNFLSGNTFRIL